MPDITSISRAINVYTGDELTALLRKAGSGGYCIQLLLAEYFDTCTDEDIRSFMSANWRDCRYALSLNILDTIAKGA